MGVPLNNDVSKGSSVDHGVVIMKRSHKGWQRVL